MVDADDAAAIERRGGRQLDVAGPVAIPHGHLDQIVLGQQGGQLGLPQIAHRRGDLLGEIDPMAVRLHPGLAFVPLAEASGGRGVEHRLALQEALDDGGRVGGVEGEAVEAGERLAAGHGVEAKLAAIKRRLALAVEAGALAAAARKEVGDEAVLVAIPTPGGIDLIGAAVHRTGKAAHVVAETVVVAHLVAELVAKGSVQGDDAAPAGAAVHLHPVGVLAAAIVGRQLGHHVGVAVLPLPGGAVDAVVGIVDAKGDELLADALTHGAAVPAPLARIKVGEQGAIRQHHLRQRQRRILADDEAAGGNGLEILPLGFFIPGKGELVARAGQHADVDGVNEQLPRRPYFEVGQFAAQIPLAQAQGEAGHDPLGRQHGAPGIAGIGDAVVFQLAIADPLAAHLNCWLWPREIVTWRPLK